jgi:hypothetical protein
MQSVAHSKIVKLHKDIADQHVDINGFFRFNVNELLGSLRSGIQTPVLAIEAASSELESPSKQSVFNSRAVSFIIIDFAGKPDSYDKQDEVLDKLETIVLEIGDYLATKNEDRSHWLYGLFEIDSFRYEKVGPLFDNMYGWNVLYTIKNQTTKKMDPAKWIIPTP